MFISLLGTSNYSTCTYFDEKTGLEYPDARFIQATTLELLQAQEPWSANDAAYIFLTPRARVANWQENPIDTEGNKKPYKGLKQVLAEKKWPLQVYDVDIPEEGNEAALWEVFSTIYERLQDRDELYLDITHGFRYLPMLLPVISNYAKVLKHTRVVHISYGNFIAPSEKKPIVDLMPLVELQAWTFAAAEFLQNGRSTGIKELTDNKLSPILKETKGKNQSAQSLRNFAKKLEEASQCLTTIRGYTIIEGKVFGELSKVAQSLDAKLIAPMGPLIKEINKSFAGFSQTTDIDNGFRAARWCREKQLYQQSISILQETLKAYVAQKASFPYDSEECQEMVGKAYHIAIKEKEKDEDLWDLGSGAEEILNRRKAIVKAYLRLPFIEETKGLYDEIGQLRNDYNHAGFRDNPQKSTNIPKAIQDKIDKVWQCTHKPRVFLNLSNHPSSDWQENQVQAAQAYGAIQDKPFPPIPPEASNREVADLAEQYARELSVEYASYDLTVHVMGEMTFCFHLVALLRERGIRCVASTTQRLVAEAANGAKEVLFEFEAFREY